MEININVSEEVSDSLREIAELHDCSIEMATRTVLERYKGGPPTFRGKHTLRSVNLFYQFEVYCS